MRRDFARNGKKEVYELVTEWREPKFNITLGNVRKYNSTSRKITFPESDDSDTEGNEVKVKNLEVDLGRNSLQVSGFKEHTKNDIEEDNGGREGETNMTYASQESFDKGYLERTEKIRDYRCL